MPAYGYGGAEPNTSCWGGGPPVYDAATSEYHMFVTEIAGHCGMSTWGRQSQAAHVTSSIISGPYRRAGLAIPTQAHNVFYAYSQPDQMHLIYHIFGGDNPESCNPYLNCTNGTTPGGHGIHPPNTPWPAPTCHPVGGAHLHYSKSLDGPWISAGRLKVDQTGMPATGGTSNPAPYVFPNGTVIMMGRGKDSNRVNGTHVIERNIVLFRAESWNSTYTFVPGNGPGGAVNIGNGRIPTEDPVIYKGRRGFHTLLHSHPDLTHAWSSDGLSWHWSPQVIGPGDMGSDNERPRISLDADGDLAVLFVSQIIGSGDASRLAAFVPRVN